MTVAFTETNPINAIQNMINPYSRASCEAYHVGVELPSPVQSSARAFGRTKHLFREPILNAVSFFLGEACEYDRKSMCTGMDMSYISCRLLEVLTSTL